MAPQRAVMGYAALSAWWVCMGELLVGPGNCGSLIGFLSTAKRQISIAHFVGRGGARTAQRILTAPCSVDHLIEQSIDQSIYRDNHPTVRLGGVLPVQGPGYTCGLAWDLLGARFTEGGSQGLQTH